MEAARRCFVDDSLSFGKKNLCTFGNILLQIFSPVKVSFSNNICIVKTYSRLSPFDRTVVSLSSVMPLRLETLVLFEMSCLKISARNILKGKVKGVVHGSVNSEISVELAGGAEIVSIITKTSAEQLKLTKGKDVYAVIKATSVMIATD